MLNTVSKIRNKLDRFRRSIIVYQGSTIDERQDLYCYRDRNGIFAAPAIAKRHPTKRVTGAAGGAVTGAIVGGPVGAAIGGAVGLVAGAVIAPPPQQVVTYVRQQPVPPIPLCCRADRPSVVRYRDRGADARSEKHLLRVRRGQQPTRDRRPKNLHGRPGRSVRGIGAG